MSDLDPIRIVIAGGGTAGWMSAAACAHFLPRTHQVTLVESDAIGTIGVGEATIPQIQHFNAALGIEEDAFLAACQGTYKLGIEFDGWLRADERYMHAFGSVGRDVEQNGFQHHWLRARSLGFAKPLDAYSLNEIVARAGRMHRGRPLTAPTVPAMPHAYHFDAGLYAAFLRRLAEGKSATRVEGEIADVARDGENGDVAALVLKDGRRIAGDLFLDCTGFRALLIGGALGQGYDDWSRWLACDSAWAVQSERTEDPRPYTRSIARAAGWQWRIPLQHRTGNGMVFSSADWEADEARAALLDNLDGAPITDPRLIRFTAGRRRRPFTRNVIAIGLASGFLEPLESTSIHLVQSAISRLMKLVPGRRVADAIRDDYNRQADFEMERIRDFIILHYWANARPEPFWRRMRAMELPETLRHKIDLWRASAAVIREHEELFTEVGWFQVFAGQGVIPDRWHPFADAVDAGELREFLGLVEALYRREAAAMPSHAQFLSRHSPAPEPA